jgi:hypothetical protein
MSFQGPPCRRLSFYRPGNAYHSESQDEYSTGAIGRALGRAVEGDANIAVRASRRWMPQVPAITFLSNPKFRAQADQTQAPR